jgi:glycogen operon protein
MYAGQNRVGKDELVYLAINSYWEYQTVTLPEPPEGYKFYLTIDTSNEQSVVQDKIAVHSEISIPPRTVMVMETYKEM